MKTEKQSTNKFQELYSLNLNDKVEKKNNLTYLSWPTAWAEFKKAYPDANYSIIKNPQNGLPYFYDENLGIMVFTEVTAGDQTYQMWLPVMDGANKAMKLVPYTYNVWDRQNRKWIEKRVEAASMYDVNKTLMRCLVKNLAMFGLGLYIFAGEDIPEVFETQTPQPDCFTLISQAISSAEDSQALLLLYQQHQNEVDTNPNIKALFTARKQELLNANAA